jgi:GNAT superfamily N-acetyltransferase
MSIELSTPVVDDLMETITALGTWQTDASPMQLHPGDLGWKGRFGAAELAASIRVWRRDGLILALGFLDEPDLLRMTIAPDALSDDDLAGRLVGDLVDPARGVLPAGRANVEAPATALVQRALEDEGWGTDDPWQPLYRDLGEPVEDAGVRVEVVTSQRTDDQVAVIRSAFERSTFTDERWQTMAASPLYEDARSLVAYDGGGAPVAAVTVWSAGPGRPGLIEPMGVHADHRGRGYGRAITIAAASALREMGSSSVRVCTPGSYTGAIATYASAGMQKQPQVRDRVRVA